MSDYMFMLESHLNEYQNRATAALRAAAGQAGVNLFLVGGAMRDMLGGFPIRDLDFSVEGNALRLTQMLCDQGAATLLTSDEDRSSAELLFPGGVTAQVSMSRQERSRTPGKRPTISPATIQEDLLGRDFTINAVALSLNRASTGLLLDPTNGLADLERRELRTVYPYAFYDDPSRLLRLVRLRLRLGFSLEARTQAHYESARAANLETQIPATVRCEELRHIAQEPSPSAVMRDLQEEKLLAMLAPPLAEAKLNFAGLSKLEKTTRALSFAGPQRQALGPFLSVLTENFTPREKAALIKAIGLGQAELDRWQKLPAQARKLERALASGTLKKPSDIYWTVSAAQPDDLVFLLYSTAHQTVRDRIRKHFQKYLPMVQEMTASEHNAADSASRKLPNEKARRALVSSRLDRRGAGHRAAPERPAAQTHAAAQGQPR